MRNTWEGGSQRRNMRRKSFSSEMRIQSRHVDLQRGAKDIQLPAISRSRLMRPCRLIPLPVLTVTTRDCGRSCDRDIAAFFTAVNRGRITRENSNCRKTLLIVDWDVRTALRLWMPTSGGLTRSTDGYHLLLIILPHYAIMEYGVES